MTTETQPARGSVQALHVYLNRLEGLAEVLAHHGLRTSLMAPPGRVPSLHVVNPAASALAEDVYVGRCQDGTWWFWWSWAERIATLDNLDAAADLIKQVLAARDQEPGAGH
jgi:hypothetical protein